MIKYIYLLYRVDHYPECNAPDKDLNSVWTDLQTMKKYMKARETEWLTKFDKEDWVVEKIELNKMYTV